MRVTKIIIIVTAALLCVAASGSTRQGPGRAVTAGRAGATTPVACSDPRNDSDTLVTAHRTLWAHPGDGSLLSDPTRSTQGRLK